MTTVPALYTPACRVLTAVTDPDDPAWHETRRSGLGSSDAAAVLGLDPWKSAYGLWLEKVGLAGVDVRESEPMEWGRILEGPIADEYARRSGVLALPAPGILQSVSADWLLASPDRMLASVDDPRPFSFVECKNVSAWKSDGWDASEGRMPPHYLVQVLEQLAVTGFDEAGVACLVGGQHFEALTVHRDDALLAVLLERMEAFWRLVESRTPPPQDDSPQTVKAVKHMRAEAGKVVDLADRSDGLRLVLDGVREAREKRLRAECLAKRLKEREDALTARVCAQMGDAEALVDGDTVLATWKATTRKSYVVKETTYRTFRLA